MSEYEIGENVKNENEFEIFKKAERDQHPERHRSQYKTDHRDRW